MDAYFLTNISAENYLKRIALAYVTTKTSGSFLRQSVDTRTLDFTTLGLHE